MSLASHIEAILVVLRIGGIGARHWFELLRENNYQPTGLGWPDTLRLSLNTLVTEAVGYLEEREFGPQLECVQLQDPIFILGQWRSGTTHLHELLSQDPRLAFCNSLQAFNPHTFLLLSGRSKRAYSRWVRWLYLRWLQLIWKGPLRDGPAPPVPQDPQEDEFAMMAVGLSPFMAHYFPRRGSYYSRFLTLDLMSREQRARWKTAWLQFLRKVALVNSDRRLVLKSPGHTGRVALIREVFPQARFVHLSRHPYQILRSALGRSTDQGRVEMTLAGHRQIYDAYFKEREKLPDGQLHELRFEDLKEDPMGQLEGLYRGLGLGGFEAAWFKEYLGKTERHRMGLYPDLSKDQKDQIYQRCARYFKAFDYSP